MASTLSFTLTGLPTGIASNLRAQFYNGVDNTTNGAAIATGFAELANGFYVFYSAAVPANLTGYCKFYRNDTSAVVGLVSVNPQTTFSVDASGNVGVQYGTGTGQLNLSAGNPAAGWVSATAAGILATPANKMATDVSGFVTFNNSDPDPWSVAIPGSYAAGTAGYILGNDSPAVIAAGTAQAGAVGSITLAAGDSAANGFYNGCSVKILSGTGAGQVRRVQSYNSTTKVATTEVNWIVAPDATSVYRIISDDAGNVLSLNAAALAQIAGNPVASVTGNVGGNVVGSVGSVTNPVTAGTVSDKTGYSLASSGLDAVVTETGVNARQALTLVLDAVAGILSGAAGTSITIKDPTGTTTRIAATVDSNGNRTAITLTPPA